jgi:hypothetical protein
MENSKTQEKIISLGKLLIAELEQQPGADFLSRWMAHYLAEQITLAESAKGRGKAAARKKCAETILILWKHRASLPNGRRPFEKFEPVLDALRGVNPDNPHPYYHRFKPADQKADSKELKLVSQLIDLIFAVDGAARVLIDAALNELTKLATTPRTKAMLKHAPNAERKDSLNAVRILFEHMERLEPESDQTNKLIQERLNKLKGFTGLCKILEGQLKKQLSKQ